MEEIIIIIAEDDIGHAGLIIKNLKRAGVSNKLIHFENGKDTIDYLHDNRNNKNSYLILLDIRMPIMDGIEVLEKIKNDKILKVIPIIILTTTDNPAEVKKCHELGCSNYITKPVNYDDFVKALHDLGLFLKIVKIPKT